MTKLKPHTKPKMNLHTIRDRARAKKNLTRLVQILETSSCTEGDTELEVTVQILKKVTVREVDV